MVGDHREMPARLRSLLCRFRTARFHGQMTTSDWCRVIDESTTVGTEMVQFIGGEPTRHPDLPRLVDHARGRGIEVEVYSNLVHVRPELWETCTRPGVRLATSYYADNAAQHEVITKRRGSHARTQRNIIEALRRSIPLRVGIVDVHDGQRRRGHRIRPAATGRPRCPRPDGRRQPVVRELRLRRVGRVTARSRVAVRVLTLVAGRQRA